MNNHNRKKHHHDHHHHHHHKGFTDIEITRQIRLSNRNISNRDINVEWKDIQGDQKLVSLEGFSNDTFIESEVPNFANLID